MGNFYTNIALKGPPAEDVLEFLRGEKRDAFVAREQHGFTVLYDKECDDQDTFIIESLTQRLSRNFGCPALASLNHDDDVLWLLLYVNGTRWLVYDSMSGPRSGASVLTTALGGFLATPLLWLVMHLPIVVFEVLRHSWIARLLRLPLSVVGSGYRYLDRDELPRGLSSDDLRHTFDTDVEPKP